jgi:UDP-2,4-diacetamido-2,4,6-trideoxy-beta-L-altropyranose hydrolase
MSSTAHFEARAVEQSPEIRNCPPRRVLVRLDASRAIGSGHLVRCLALADHLHLLGAKVCFLVGGEREIHDAILGDSPHEYLRVESAVSQYVESATGTADELEDARRSKQAVQGREFDWIVVDHYALGAAWESQAREMAPRILAIDDLADRRHDCDAILDQSIGAIPKAYASSVGSRLLLGTRYALLRPVFLELSRSQGASVDSIRHILACVGGADPLNVLPRIIEAWRTLPANRPTLTVAVGRHSANLDALRSLCGTCADLRLAISAPDLPQVMRDADLLITGGGTVNWERCCIGRAAIMIKLAGNQTQNIRELVRARTGVALPGDSDFHPDQLRRVLVELLDHPRLVRRMGVRANRLVDGMGGRRAAAFMLAPDTAVRPVGPEDCERAWLWRNDPGTRRYSNDSSPIALDTHRAWWSRVLVAPDRQLLMGHIGGCDFGVVRLDAVAPQALVSIYLDPDMVGLGLGAHLLRSAHAWARSHWPRITRLVAEIHPDNLASVATFRAVGYNFDSSKWVFQLNNG